MNEQPEQQREAPASEGHRPSLIEELRTKAHVLFIECGQPQLMQDGVYLRLGPEMNYPHLKSTLEELWRALKFRTKPADRDRITKEIKNLPVDYSPGALQDASDIFDSIYIVMDSLGLGLPTSPMLPLREEKRTVLIQKWSSPSPIQLNKRKR